MDKIENLLQEQVEETRIAFKKWGTLKEGHIKENAAKRDRREKVIQEKGKENSKQGTEEKQVGESSDSELQGGEGIRESENGGVERSKEIIQPIENEDQRQDEGGKLNGQMTVQQNGNNGERQNGKSYSEMLTQGDEDKENPFTIVNTRKKIYNRQSTANVGPRPSGRSAKCYVGRCDRKTTASEIKTYIEKMVRNEIDEKVDCLVVELKREGVSEGWSRSFQVTVPTNIKPLIMIEKYWPKGIIVRNFFEKRKQEKKRESKDIIDG